MVKHRFLELDCLRGIAALFVVFFHIFGNGYLALGATGVDLFFIISGFVIFLSINSVSSGKEFVINRTSRLYPTYWTCVTITFLLMSLNGDLAHHTIHLKLYLANLTMFQFYLKKPDLDGPYWTMIVEMIFYIFILALFVFKWLKYIISIGIIITILLLINALLYLNNLPHLDTHYIPLLAFFPLFFAGIIFYEIYFDHPLILNKYLLLLVCYITQITLFKFTKSSTVVNQTQYAVMVTLYFSLFILFVNGWLKFIICKPLLFFGKISFALYLIHQYFLRYVLVPYLISNFNLSHTVSGLIGIAIAIGLATLINRYCEVPGGKKMKSLLKKAFFPKVENVS